MPALQSPSYPLAGLLEPIPVTGPAEMWGFDFAGPMPLSPLRQQYILLAVDYSTRFCVAQAIRRPTAKAIVSFFEKQILSHIG